MNLMWLAKGVLLTVKWEDASLNDMEMLNLYKVTAGTLRATASISGSDWSVKALWVQRGEWRRSFWDLLPPYLGGPWDPCDPACNVAEWFYFLSFSCHIYWVTMVPTNFCTVLRQLGQLSSRLCSAVRCQSAGHHADCTIDMLHAFIFLLQMPDLQDSYWTALWLNVNEHWGAYPGSICCAAACFLLASIFLGIALACHQ